MIYMYKIDKISTDENLELKRLLCEIRAKNGLPPEEPIFTSRINDWNRSDRIGFPFDNPHPSWKMSTEKMLAMQIEPGKKSKKKDIGAQKELSRKGKKSAKIEEKTPIKKETKVKQEDIIHRGPFSGKLSLIQSTYGNKGNFELIVPLATGGLAHYARNNDVEELPWSGPARFGHEAGLIDGVSMIQSDFGASGNLEVVAVDSGGHNLLHFWRDSGPSFDWHGPLNISEKSIVPVFSGNPAMIWSNLGLRGNYDVVVPRTNGSFAHYWRDNDDSALPWHGPFEFAKDAGTFNAVTLIQSNFGEPGNLELIARFEDKLAFFWRDSGSEFKWSGPEIIATGAAGTPSMIQSTFGNKGNFELVVPMASGGLAYYWRDNDNDRLSWHGPLMFGMNLGKIESVALIQSNFGIPGHLELAAQSEGQVAFFWRDSGPDFRWNGPQYLTV
jgi:hypothetical protein